MDVNRINRKRQHKIGTMFHDEFGGKYRYAKIDFGIVGTTDIGKKLRNIVYGWLPQNALAKGISYE